MMEGQREVVGGVFRAQGARACCLRHAKARAHFASNPVLSLSLAGSREAPEAQARSWR